MKHREYSGVQRSRLYLPKHQRFDLNETRAELARMRATMLANAEAKRQESAARLTDSIQLVIMNMSVTGRLALNVVGKHALASKAGWDR